MTVRMIRRVAAATSAAVGVLAGVAMGTGTAAADTVEVPMDRCWGISPYILDQPYAPARLFSWQTGPGRTQLQMPDVASLWFFTGGYQTDVKLDWHNVDTGERGTLYDNATVSNPGNDVVTFDLDSGPGDVEFTVSAVNSIPLWSIPTTSCGGVVSVA